MSYDEDTQEEDEEEAEATDKLSAASEYFLEGEDVEHVEFSEDDETVLGDAEAQFFGDERREEPAEEMLAVKQQWFEDEQNDALAYGCSRAQSSFER